MSILCQKKSTTSTDLPVQYEDPVKKINPYVLINTTDIYKITENQQSALKNWVEYTPGSTTHYKYEWAVVTLERNASSTQKRMCYYQNSDVLSKIGVGSEELCSWGFPDGLSMKFVDDAHLKFPDYYRIDMDVYHGNSGGPIFIKVNSKNQSSYQNKVMGVICGGFKDHTVQNGTSKGISCLCMSDILITPTQPPTPWDYIGVSLIDNLWVKTGISTGNCSKPYTPPTPPPPPSPAKQLTPGQKPVISFTPKVSALHTITMSYSENNTTYETYQTQPGYTGRQFSKTMKFLPAGTKYNYKVTYMSGRNELYLTSGSGQANSSTMDYGTTATKIQSMAYVGNTSEFPFKTLQDAINNSPSGTTLHVARGVYNETLEITKPMKLIGEDFSSGNGCAMIVCSSALYAIRIVSSDVTIQNINFLSTRNNESIGILLDNATNCNINNNYFSNFTYGITLKNGCTGNFISNNLFCESISIFKNFGIHIESSSNNTISNNIMDFGENLFWFGDNISQNNVFSGNSVKDVFFQNYAVTQPSNDVNASNSITINNVDIYSGGKINFQAGQTINVGQKLNIQPGANVNLIIDPNAK